MKSGRITNAAIINTTMEPPIMMDRGTHRGDETHSQVQSIIPVTLRSARIKNSIAHNPSMRNTVEVVFFDFIFYILEIQTLLYEKGAECFCPFSLLRRSNHDIFPPQSLYLVNVDLIWSIDAASAATSAHFPASIPGSPNTVDNVVFNVLISPSERPRSVFSFELGFTTPR
jgi:hypothetical protein